MIDSEFITETKIVGVTQFNEKGFPIQMLLRDLNAGDRLIFIRDYGNQYDENAIKVYSRAGEHIGYISKELAKEIAPFLDKNMDYDLEGLVLQVTGGEDGKSFGCNIRIWIEVPDEPNYEEINNFQNQYINPNKKLHKKTDIYFSIGITAIIIFVILGVCSIPFIFKNSSDSTNENKEEYVIEELITLNEYNRLSVGMSRSDVYEIVGSFGELISESSTEGYYVKTYSYEGYGSIGANAQLMFTNGTLDTMAQFGLENYYGKESGTTYEIADSPFLTPENEVPIKINDLVFSLKVLPPNSIGTVYIEGTYTNSSKYVISGMTLTILLKDKNEKTFLSCYDTIMPGETSAKFDSFGPQTQSFDDVEFLECKITMLGENNEKIFITYDYKLKSYEVV